jgi:hypothetical protein
VLTAVEVTAGADVTAAEVLFGACADAGADVTDTAVTVGVAAAEVPVELVHPAATMRRKQAIIKRAKDFCILS